MRARLIRWVRENPARAGTLAGWYQQASSIISSFVALDFLLNVLDPHASGLWLSLLGIVTMIGLADFGFSMALSRQVAHSLQFDAERYTTGETDLIATRAGWAGISDLFAAGKLIFRRVNLFAVLLIVVLYELVLPRTALLGAKSMETALAWYALGAAMILAFQARLSQSFLDGLGLMYLGRFVTGTYQLILNGGIVAVLLLRPGLLGLALALLGAQTLHFLAMEWMLRRVSGGRLARGAPPPGLTRDLWRVSLPFGFVASGGYLVGAVQVPMLGALLGPAVVAPYYLASRVSQTVSTVVMQITTPQLPLFTQECARGAWRGAQRRMRRWIVLGTGLHVAVAGFLYFGSPPLVDWYFGPGKYLSGLPFLVLCINHLLSCGVVVVAHFVLAFGRNPFAWSTLFHGLLTLGGVVLLCPRLGVLGAPLSSLIAVVLTNFWFTLWHGWQTWQALKRADRASAAI